MNQPQTQSKNDIRSVCYVILQQILHHGKDIESAFSSNEALAEHDTRDHAFARQLVMNCLRYRKPLTHAYSQYLTKKLGSSQRDISLIFQIGTAQVLLMEVADHAAVHTSVELAKTLKAPYAPGLVNAVLKKVVADKEALLDGIVKNAEKPFPHWLSSRWEAQYGAAIALSMSLSTMKEPPLDITIKDPETAEHWLERLGGEMLSTGTLRMPHRSGRVSALAGFDDGAWWVQDASSALPVRLLGDIKDKRILDACAAPGGKTMQLAAAGAKVTALDKSEKRLERLRENLERTELYSSIICEDVLDHTPAEPYDIVLLDAPCSATGTLRRHPDLMWHKSERDITSLMGLQKDLLNHAVSLLKKDGILLYCTCSLEKEESENQIETLLQENQSLELVRITKKEAKAQGLHVRWITAEGTMRVLPHFNPSEVTEYGMDGFYAARLKKVV